jgi:hypothetical protein
MTSKRWRIGASFRTPAPFPVTKIMPLLALLALLPGLKSFTRPSLPTTNRLLWLQSFPSPTMLAMGRIRRRLRASSVAILIIYVPTVPRSNPKRTRPPRRPRMTLTQPSRRNPPAGVVVVVVQQMHESLHLWLLGNTLNPRIAPKNILI